MQKQKDKEQVIFSSINEECAFWKKKYQEKEKELLEVEESFAEFQQSSKELEAELEREPHLNEQKLKDITTQFHRLKVDFEESKAKSIRSTEQSADMIHRLQEEVAALKREKGQLLKERQRLEHENDNLERKEREAQASLEDANDKLNKLLEENAFLQTELEEQNNRNQETLQRLKEEIRDLKLELSLATGNLSRTQEEGTQDLEHPVSTIVVNETPDSPIKVPPNGKLKRSSSLAMINDMLILVKDLENRLYSAKKPNFDDLSSMLQSSPIPLAMDISGDLEEW